MRKWECGVCGFIHKEEGPPEKCPVCEAPRKMFKEVVEESQGETGGAAAGAAGMKKWQCAVCGHGHTGTGPPDKCPVCDTPGTMFVAMEHTVHGGAGPAQGKRWRCTVCGYIHTGDEPPEKCPVCAAPKGMFVEIDEEGKAKGEPAAAAIETVVAAVGEKSAKHSPSWVDRIAHLILKLHLHPISAHFPNGVLPVVLIFLGLSMFFNIVTLETAAYYNLIFVLLTMPIVVLTGFCEWQKRYKGLKTAIFITKLICGLTVLATTNVLVFWRLLDPAVLAEGSPWRMTYLGVAGAMLGATGLAGHLGGKLVFGPRGG